MIRGFTLLVLGLLLLLLPNLLFLVAVRPYWLREYIHFVIHAGIGGIIINMVELVLPLVQHRLP